MDEHGYLPDSNRLSVLTSVILLAYALIPFIQVPSGDFSVQLPGLFLVLPLRFSFLVSLLSAALAALGTDWLLHDHPERKNEPLWQHGLIPALTTWVIGVPLNSLNLGLGWWAVFGFGSALLVLVFMAEYIVVDLSDARHAIATVWLTAVSFALYLVIAITVRALEFRVYLMVPFLVVPMVLVSLRTLYLRLGGRWCVMWSIGLSIAIGQIALGLRYWPLKPLTFGLILLGIAYSFTSFAGAIEEDRQWRSLWIEPVVMLLIIWGLAFILR
jgi:hypothetical protein